MTKKDLINGCIDMSYNVTKSEMIQAVFDASGQRYMETKMSADTWRNLYEKLQSIVEQENGSAVLFYGSNVEHYRQ